MDLIEQVKERFIKYDGKDMRRISHALKVHSFARYIAVSEGVSPELLQTIEIAAVVHDIGIHVSEQKYGSSMGKYQEIEGPAVAEEVLKGLDISKEEMERVKFLIAHHHHYANIDALDWQILVEADFVVNIDEDCIKTSEVQHIVEHVLKTKTSKELIKGIFL